MIDESEVIGLAEHFLGESVELEYLGFRPILGSEALESRSYHLAFYDNH